VQKPLFGSEGKGLVRLAAGDLLPPSQQFAQLHYLQQFVEPEDNAATAGRHRGKGSSAIGRGRNDDGGGYSDFRVMVIGGRARFAMRRRSVTWISNVAQGARCEAVDLDSELADLSERAAAALQIDYAGVDLIADRDGQRLVIEVNGIPAWRGLQSVVAENIALALARDFVTRRLRVAPAQASA
jgi:tetrahydromethanopterin:alpha-L-glutamate ligase